MQLTVPSQPPPWRPNLRAQLTNHQRTPSPGTRTPHPHHGGSNAIAQGDPTGAVAATKRRGWGHTPPPSPSNEPPLRGGAQICKPRHEATHRDADPPVTRLQGYKNRSIFLKITKNQWNRTGSNLKTTEFTVHCFKISKKKIKIGKIYVKN
jgi:hypothetical protein